MTFGFDGSRAFTPGRTGTENYSYQLLKALAKIDRKNKYLVYVRPNSVILRSASDEGSSPTMEDSSPASPGQNDNSHWPGNFQFKVISWPRLWTQGGLALETFKDNPDVLFVPAHTLPLIRKPGLKTVVTVHDLGSEYLPSMHQLKQQLYLGFMQKFQLKTATKIIAVSKATKEDLIKRVGIDPKKVNVVYEGYDKDLFKPVKGDTLVNSLRQYKLKPQEYFLFVGTVQPRKNLERLIKAFSVIARNEVTKQSSPENNPTKIASPASPVRNDELKLAIIGQRGWLSDEIYQLPKKLGIEDMVKFLGYVPDKDLPALYSGAIALTFPSLFEGFGLPVLEAQACGCPVLTSNISSMPEVAGPAAAGGAVLVDPYSVDDIVKGMGRLQAISKACDLTVLGNRQQLVKKGLENVGRFSWEKCAAQTLEVLESI